MTLAPLPWTGERYLPSVGGIIQLEHVHRYLMARLLARGKDVLDIASGEGYGSAMLAEEARSVIGVDNSEHAVLHAAATYRMGNLQYRHGACEAIPLDDCSVDLVVSFETIEHHDQHEAMMREIRRVLRPDGLLVISSPDKYEYSEVRAYQNPYHVKELYQREFEALIGKHFLHAAYLGQRVVYGSAIFQTNHGGSMLSFRRVDDRIVTNQGIACPYYLIAVASNVPLPELPGGFYVQAFDDTPNGFDVEIQVLNARLVQLAREWDATKAELARSVSEARHLRLELEGSEAALEAMTDSTSWRLSAPIRWAGSGIRSIRRKIARGARWMYRALPVSIERKMALKSRIFSTFGTFLSGLESYRAWRAFEGSDKKMRNGADTPTLRLHNVDVEHEAE